jgi:uncharacterized protein (TIGR03435 family)
MIRQAFLDYADGRRNLCPMTWTIPIENAPHWLQSEGYTIEAEADPAQTEETMMGPVLQAILEDRFKLKIHRETREVAAYALTVAPGGPKLELFKEGSCVRRAAAEVSASSPSESRVLCTREWPNVPDTADLLIRAQGVTPKELCDCFLSGYIDDSHRFVMDETGLTGRFDIHLVFAPSDEPARVQFAKLQGYAIPNPTAPPLASAIEQQLGLQLKATTAPGEFLVIDHVEQPSSN